MSILIVGGDKLGTITTKLKDVGFTEIKHLSGRKRGHLTYEMPRKLDIVLVLTDYVNHRLAAQIKEKARERGTKTVFARRTWANIFQALK